MASEFKETQRFRQWWFWLLLSPLIILTLILVIKQLILGQPLGTKPLSNVGVYVFALFTLAITCLFLFLRLETTVNETGIFMNYRPFIKRNCLWEDIEKAEIVDYGFVGYGFRWWPKHGWIFNVGGHMGLKIQLKSGKQFTIGTQKTEVLRHMLETTKRYSSKTS